MIRGEAYEQGGRCSAETDEEDEGGSSGMRSSNMMSSLSQSLPASLVTAAVVGVAASALVLAAMLALGSRLPASLPDHRTLHHGAVPRTGGLAVWAGVLAGVALGTPLPAWTWILVPLVAVFVLEDWRGLSPWVRLGTQAAAALAYVYLLRLPSAGAWGATLLAVAILLWAANLYNFMDGADGLAGSMTVIGFGACALAAGAVGDPGPAALAILVAVSALSFVVVNWQPARIFLGDAGAVGLGFAAAGLGIDGVARGTWPPWFPLLVFLPFVTDASLTLVRRGVQGHHLAEAHRDHCYQRLVLLGWGHARTALAYGFIMTGCAATALAALRWLPEKGWVAVLGWSLILTVLYFVVDRRWRLRTASA